MIQAERLMSRSLFWGIDGPLWVAIMERRPKYYVFLRSPTTRFQLETFIAKNLWR